MQWKKKLKLGKEILRNKEMKTPEVQYSHLMGTYVGSQH